MWAQLKTVMLEREAIQLAFLWAWRTKLIFQIQIIISNLVNVLTIFSIHFAIHLINKSVSFHGKLKIVWVTPNFWTVLYIQKITWNKQLQNSTNRIIKNKWSAVEDCRMYIVRYINHLYKEISDGYKKWWKLSISYYQVVDAFNCFLNDKLPVWDIWWGSKLQALIARKITTFKFFLLVWGIKWPKLAFLVWRLCLFTSIL